MCQRSVRVHGRKDIHLVVFAVFFEELFAEGVFDGVVFTEGGEVVGGGGEVQRCAGVGADALSAAHRSREEVLVCTELCTLRVGEVTVGVQVVAVS